LSSYVNECKLLPEAAVTHRADQARGEALPQRQRALIVAAQVDFESKVRMRIIII